MTRQPFKSSNIESAGFDGDTKEIEVEFKNGDVWRYSGMSQEHWDGMNNAKSAGKFFHNHIRRIPQSRQRKIYPLIHPKE